MEPAYISGASRIIADLEFQFQKSTLALIPEFMSTNSKQVEEEETREYVHT